MFLAGFVVRPILRVSLMAVGAAAIATLLGFDPTSLLPDVIPF